MPEQMLQITDDGEVIKLMENLFPDFKGRIKRVKCMIPGVCYDTPPSNVSVDVLNVMVELHDDDPRMAEIEIEMEEEQERLKAEAESDAIDEAEHQAEMDAAGDEERARQYEEDGEMFT
ncbi:MAG: hypothetical protein ACTSSE_08695 [Candidatus Thorarchaeota archaeon]